MRFIHSHSDLGLFLKSDLLDSERDLWVLHGDGFRFMDKEAYQQRPVYEINGQA